MTAPRKPVVIWGNNLSKIDFMAMSPRNRKIRACSCHEQWWKGHAHHEGQNVRTSEYGGRTENHHHLAITPNCLKAGFTAGGPKPQWMGEIT